MDFHLLSEQGKLALQRLMEMGAKDIGRLPHEDLEAENYNPEEMYVAVPPCGEGIPARNGVIPGQNRCCLFKLVMSDGTSESYASSPLILIPVNDPRTGLPVQRIVYNIYDQDIPALLPPNEKYIQIKRSKDGKWLVVPSVQFASGSTTTTTSSGLLEQNCVSKCKWIWNGTYWTTDGCTTSSTTTTTTTSSSTTSSTTTSPCLCQGTTSSTTTTTTTTCTFCPYPPFCGTSVGQCYFASCTDNATNIISSCSNSTTTTPFCDCATTSTAGPCYNPPCGGQDANCGFNCTWHWNGTQWVLVYQNCLNCAYPPANADKCSVYIEPCGGDFGPFFGGGPGGGQQVAAGAGIPVCCWCWDPLTNQWTLPATDCGTGGNYFDGQWIDFFCVCSYMLGPLVCDDTCHYVSGAFICVPPPPPTSVPDGSTCQTNSCLSAYTRALYYCDVNPGTPCKCTDPSICPPLNPALTTTTTDPNTTTTPDPACNCGFCYTTTTLAPISGQCIWQCSGAGGSWSLISSGCSCSVSCTCYAPLDPCLDSCQVQVSACTATTTTT